MEKGNPSLITAALIGDRNETKFAKCISKYWRSKGVKVAPKDVVVALKRVDYDDILGATTSQEITRLIVSSDNKKRLSRFTA